jgi:hypothetical protein
MVVDWIGYYASSRISEYLAEDWNECHAGFRISWPWVSGGWNLRILNYDPAELPLTRHPAVAYAEVVARPAT